MQRAMTFGFGWRMLKPLQRLRRDRRGEQEESEGSDETHSGDGLDGKRRSPK